MLAVFLAFTLGGLLVEDLLGQTTYSRYLLAVPPVLAVFLLREPVAAAVARPVALVAGLTALAVVLTVGTLRSDAARWEAASALVAEGVDPMSIAAGQEWSGWHTGGVAVHARRDAPGDQAWWTGMFSDASECWLVTLDGRDRRATGWCGRAPASGCTGRSGPAELLALVGYQRSGLLLRESAVRQTRQWPHVTMRCGLLGPPHSGHSTVASVCVLCTCSARAAWTASSPAQGQPTWASVQRAVSIAMVRLLGCPR